MNGRGVRSRQGWRRWCLARGWALAAKAGHVGLQLAQLLLGGPAEALAASTQVAHQRLEGWVESVVSHAGITETIFSSFYLLDQSMLGLHARLASIASRSDAW